MKPKENLAKINQLLCEGKTEEAIYEIKHALEIDHQAYLNYFFSNLDETTRKQIANLVDGIDHVAILTLPTTTIETLESLSTRIGLTDNHQVVPSRILTKELGALLGKNEVPTKIFKAWGKSQHNKKIGIEVFITQESIETVQNWIKGRVGEHVSLRVKSQEAFMSVLEILAHHNIPWPEFMQGKPILKHEMYFDNVLSDGKVRVEFTYAT